MAKDDPSQTAPPPRPAGYLARSKWPLQVFYFLLPLIVIYELGLVVYGANQDIVARTLMRRMYEWAGVTGYYLPGLVAVVVLICWHIARRDPWRPQFKLYPVMFVESVVMAAPPFVFMLVLTRQLPMAAALAAGAEPTMAGDPWQAQLVFSIGAGIYEELLFRLIGIAAIHLVIVDLCRAPHQWGAVMAVVITSIAFALYHFTPENPFTWGKFTFYTGAGLYFAVLYLGRGFGIAAGAHAMYDVFVLVMQEWQRGG